MIISGKRALITGGSSGIGFAAAQALGGKGVALAVTGRHPSRLAAAVEALQKAGASVNRLEPSHVPFAPPDWLVRDFAGVVQISALSVFAADL